MDRFKDLKILAEGEVKLGEPLLSLD